MSKDRTVAAMKYRIKGTQVYVKAQADPFLGTAVLPRGYASTDAASLTARIQWRPSNAGPNSINAAALPLVRSRSRDKVRNDGLANSILEILTTDIIANGIKPQFTSKVPAFNQELAERFLRWTDEADADDMLDYYGLQALILREMFEGGDVFVRFRNRFVSDGLSVPLQLQVLESEFCPAEKTGNGQTPGSYIQSGIEFNQIADRIAYWMYRQHPYDQMGANPFGAGVPVAVPASEVMHVLPVKRAGVIRGLPLLTRVLPKLKDLDEYDDAQLVRQKIAALFVASVESGTDEINIEESFEEQTEADDNGLAFAYVEPGTVQAMKPGQKMNWNQPPNPGNSFDVYMRHQERRIASGGGVLYESLSGDYTGITDRTWRSAMTNYRRRCERIQNDFIFQCPRLVVKRFLKTLEIGGITKFPAGLTADTMPFTHLLPPWPYINPVQDIEAINFEIRSGLSSREAEVSARADDVEQIDAANARDHERTDKLNLTYDSDPRRMTRAGASVIAKPSATGADASAGGAGGGGGGGGETVVPFKRRAVSADLSGLREQVQALSDKLDEVLSYNPNHEPAGTPEGGQFAPSGGSGGGGGRNARTTEPSPGTKKSGFRDGGRIPGSSGGVETSRRADLTTPLSGLPTKVNIPGHGEIKAGPFDKARQAAYDYTESAGIDYHPPTDYVKVDPERAKRIAGEYDKMQNDPENPEVKAAYDAMIKETVAQWHAIEKTGLNIDWIDYAKDGDPYAASPRLATEDVRNNNHLWVFPTHSGFGSNETFDASKNPLLADTGIEIKGHKLVANDVFRIVHDYFGHIKEGNGFRADGEENAWRSHSAMYSPLARRAMTSETRGQNSWVNYGPYGEQNRSASSAETHFADQKVGLMPEWTSTEGSGSDSKDRPRAYRPDQPRYPAGTRDGGKFAPPTIGRLKKVGITIDEESVSSPTPTTGQSLYILGKVKAGYGLWYNKAPEADVLIHNDPAPIELRGGDAFYTKPHPGNARAYNQNHVPAGSPGGGQFTTDGGGGSEERDKSPAHKDAEAENDRRVGLLVQRVADRRGFTGPIQITHDKYDFQVGDVHMTAAGTYSPVDKTIRVYPDVVAPSFLDELMVHETQHARNDAVQNAYMKEYNDIINRPGADPIKPDGSLKSDFEKDYPVYAIMQKWLDPSTDVHAQLQERDGISEYSRKYWTPEALKMSNAWTRAVDETLAEMAVAEDKGYAPRLYGAKIWRDYYSDMNKAWELTNTKPDKEPRLL